MVLDDNTESGRKPILRVPFFSHSGSGGGGGEMGATIRARRVCVSTQVIWDFINSQPIIRKKNPCVSYSTSVASVQLSTCIRHAGGFDVWLLVLLQRTHTHAHTVFAPN